MNGTQSVSSLEIKLTALPDNPTCDFSEDAYGSEIVIRPDTIIYLACAFIYACNDDRNVLQSILQDAGNAVIDWTSASCVLPHLYDIYPVSYTHLDVYKRQHRGLPGGRRCCQGCL